MHEQTQIATAPRRAQHVLTIRQDDLDDARRAAAHHPATDDIHEYGFCAALPVEESIFIGEGF